MSKALKHAMFSILCALIGHKWESWQGITGEHYCVRCTYWCPPVKWPRGPSED